ncbi:MAG: hypothetical protein ABIV47_13505 [Roseiflexaceae bacterium]
MMRKKKPRGGGRLIELAIFGVLVLVVAAVLVFVTGLTSISAFLSPAAATARPIAIAGGLPTPAPTITRMPVVTPTTVATPVPTAASATALAPTGQVLLISYLRTDPRVADDTRQAILCPDDTVEYLKQQTVEDLVWYHVRVAQLAADCNARRAPLGTEGWASSNVVSAPSGMVAAAAP